MTEGFEFRVFTGDDVDADVWVTYMVTPIGRSHSVIRVDAVHDTREDAEDFVMDAFASHAYHVTETTFTFVRLAPVPF